MKFAIGDTVVVKETLRPHTSFTADKVVAIMDGAVVVTHHAYVYGEELHVDDEAAGDYISKPGTRGWREALQRYQEEELFSYEEALVEMSRLEVALGELENEFQSIRSQVGSKLDQAALLVKEAAAMIEPFDKSFTDLHTECMKLYRALDDGGWRESSMRC